MPRAEVGSTKYVANKMKSKGLQRLRWWCQACSKQCRDANGFKCHVQSESHVRQMQIVGEDPKKYIEQFSREFHHDFITLLRVAHGEKFVDANRFYQEYIANKEHVHMNATKWPSLTEYVKYLGRESICYVKESDKGALMIAWKDVTPEAVRRREAVRQAEMLESKNEAGEDKMLKRMAQRAKLEAEAKAKATEAKAAESPAIEEVKPPTPPSSDGNGADAAKVDEAPKVETAPVKFGFGLKSKVPAEKPAEAPVKKKSVFKRMRDDSGESKSAKKLKV